MPHCLGLANATCRLLYTNLTALLIPFSLDELKGVLQAAWLDHRGIVNATQSDLQASLDAARKQGPAFMVDVRTGGWQVEKVTIRTGQVLYKRQRRPEVAHEAQ